MLGIAPTAKGYDIGYACADTHDKINIWAKYKPVRHDFMGELTEAQRASTKFGINIGISMSDDPYLNNIKAGYKGTAWSYLPPNRAGDNCRLTDFEKYYHYAVPFVRTGIPKGEVKSINIMSTTNISFSVLYNNSLNEYCIQLSDLEAAMPGLKELYLAGVLYDDNPLDNSNATMLVSKISDGPITDGSGYLTFSFTSSDIATNRWVMLYLISKTSNYSLCLPYDDANYVVFKLNIEQRYPVSADITRMGVIGSTIRDIDYWRTNAFPSSNGNANIVMLVRMSNTGTTPAVIGTGYKFRTLFDSRYTTDLTLSDSSGNSLGTQTLSPGQTNYFYFRANQVFKEFVSSMTVSQLSANMSIQGYNNNAPAPAWQVVGGQVPILVGK